MAVSCGESTDAGDAPLGLVLIFVGRCRVIGTPSLVSNWPDWLRGLDYSYLDWCLGWKKSGRAVVVDVVVALTAVTAAHVGSSAPPPRLFYRRFDIRMFLEITGDFATTNVNN